MNTALLCTMMIMVGYSSYALIVIRSTANTPMDQNSPEDIFTLGEYLGREQYGTRPLFYGQAYSSKVALEVKDGYCIPVEANSTTKYIRKEKTSPDEKDSYVEVPGRVEYQYAQNMLFPRMYSSAHIPQYKGWVDIKGYDVPYDECGNAIMVNIPTQWENIKFFFRYQLNFMYWRYFMWNFAGRQNDLQGSGEIEHGNWITGIPFIDNWLVGDQSLLPQELKDNKGHNVFYCLPLLLGLIGLLLAGLPRTERRTAILGSILPVLHDRYCHCALPQPDSRASPANETMHMPAPSTPSPSGSVWAWQVSSSCLQRLRQDARNLPACCPCLSTLPAGTHPDGRPDLG